MLLYLSSVVVVAIVLGLPAALVTAVVTFLTGVLLFVPPTGRARPGAARPRHRAAHLPRRRRRGQPRRRRPQETPARPRTATGSRRSCSPSSPPSDPTAPASPRSSTPAPGPARRRLAAARPHPRHGVRRASRNRREDRTADSSRVRGGPRVRGRPAGPSGRGGRRDRSCWWPPTTDCASRSEPTRPSSRRTPASGTRQRTPSRTRGRSSSWPTRSLARVELARDRSRPPWSPRGGQPRPSHPARRHQGQRGRAAGPRPRSRRAAGTFRGGARRVPQCRRSRLGPSDGDGVEPAVHEQDRTPAPSPRTSPRCRSTRW